MLGILTIFFIGHYILGVKECNYCNEDFLILLFALKWKIFSVS